MVKFITSIGNHKLKTTTGYTISEDHYNIQNLLGAGEFWQAILQLPILLPDIKQYYYT